MPNLANLSTSKDSSVTTLDELIVSPPETQHIGNPNILQSSKSHGLFAQVVYEGVPDTYSSLGQLSFTSSGSIGSNTSVLNIFRSLTDYVKMFTDGHMEVSSNIITEGLTVNTSLTGKVNQLTLPVGTNNSVNNNSGSTIGSSQVSPADSDYKTNAICAEGSVRGKIMNDGGNLKMTDGTLFACTIFKCRVTNQNSFDSNPGVTSDDRLKHNEIDITNALTTVNKLKPQSYYKTQEFYEYNKVFASDEIPPDAFYESGYIAQDIREISELAHLVSGEEFNGSDATPLTLNYVGIQPFLCKAIQELSAKNDALEARLATLEAANQS